MTKQARISYGFVMGIILLVAWFGLATPFLTVLFSFFVLQCLRVGESKLFALVAFALVVVVAGSAFLYFFNESLHAFPKIADNVIPALMRTAHEFDLKLPFTDLVTLKAMVLDTLMEEFKAVSKHATVLLKQFVLLLIGIVVAVSLFLNSKLELDDQRAVPNNAYGLVAREIMERFRGFYISFATVMGAQIIISAINTLLTTAFILYVHLPYAGLVIAVTFFCGLLPIIGNILSNTVIVSIALTLSPAHGLGALAFLVVLHKLEYFLNSKIIGSRIKNPMWLTLLALIIGERLMGVAGMILAPVVLHYVKVETSKIRMEQWQQPTVPEPGDSSPAERVA